MIDLCDASRDRQLAPATAEHRDGRFGSARELRRDDRDDEAANVRLQVRATMGARSLGSFQRSQSGSSPCSSGDPDR